MKSLIGLGGKSDPRALIGGARNSRRVLRLRHQALDQHFGYK